MEKRHLKNSAVIISMVVLICSCGYKFLSTSKAKIFVSPVVNYSLQPLVDIYLTNALRDVFIEYPEYQPVKNSSDAEYILDVHIKKWERVPLFFSEEKSREIAIAKFSVETEIILHRNGKVILTNTIADNISVSLAKSYQEEDILYETSKKLALKIYFYILERK